MPRTLLLCALLALASASGPARANDDAALKPSAVLPAAGPEASPEASPELIPTIDPEAIRADIATLAADDFKGRSFRSEEARRAAQWIAERLTTAGAKPLVKGADGAASK